ncbi:MAG: hypothetical protein AAF959_15825, partial [Cyanobacteria bacterium P01_D01_bin.56]
LAPNEETIFTANDDGTARQWDLTCEQVMVFAHGNKNVDVRDVVSSPDGEFVITVGSDKTAKLWTPDGTLINTLTGHTEVIFQVLFNPDGQSLATAANDQTVKIWNLQGELLNTLWHPKEIQRMRYSQDGQQLIVAHGKTPTLWNLDSEVLQPVPSAMKFQTLMQQSCTWLQPYLNRAGNLERDQNLCRNSRQ